MRLVLVSAVCLAACSLTGCSMMQQAYKHQSDQMYDYHDDWKQVGSEGRAELPREQESDKLSPLLQSPQARAIEKNLGYD